MDGHSKNYATIKQTSKMKVAKTSMTQTTIFDKCPHCNKKFTSFQRLSQHVFRCATRVARRKNKIDELRSAGNNFIFLSVKTSSNDCMNHKELFKRSIALKKRLREFGYVSDKQILKVLLETLEPMIGLA